MQEHLRRTSRRTKTRHTGVYKRELANGRTVFDVSLKVDGKLVWKRVEGGERDAVRARADLLSKAGRGERIAPSRETFEPFARAWLESQRGLLAERTFVEYERSLNRHLIPVLGARRLSAISVDTVARLISDLSRKGLKPWTVRGILTPLGRTLNAAVRRGLITENPMRRLERGERPRVERREQRILQADEIAKLLSNAPQRYRLVLATALSTGLREMELLGLTWGDLDFGANVVRVRAQLSRVNGERKPLKTGAAKRDVLLTGSIARELKAHRLASPFAQEHDYVFCTSTGRPMSWSNVIRRGLHKAVENAKLREPRSRFHDLRHTFASLLIGQGADVVYVSRAMGHADPAVTLRVYSHLWAGREHGEHFRALLDTTLSAAVSTGG